MSRAWTRFARNRGALAASLILVAMMLACLVGPFLTGHEPGRIYPDLVRIAPGLAAHPEPGEVAPALTRLAFRMRVSVSDVTVSGDRVRMVVSDPARPVDERVLAYLPRSDLFGAPRIVERLDEGRRLVVEAPLGRLRFLMGTDMLGRDLLTRSLVAGRVSLLIGGVATAVALLIGIAYGAAAGYLGGVADAVMMRIVDTLYALPFVFFVIMLLVFFRSGLGLILVAIGAVEWLDMARLVRAQTLSLRARDFVRAAEALGLSTPAILWRHIVPNTLRSRHGGGDPAGAQGDPARELPVVPRSRGAGAGHQLGGADRGRRAHPRIRPVDARRPRRLSRPDPHRPQHDRRRSRRCPRPAPFGDLTVRSRARERPSAAAGGSPATRAGRRHAGSRVADPSTNGATRPNADRRCRSRTYARSCGRGISPRRGRGPRAR